MNKQVKEQYMQRYLLYVSRLTPKQRNWILLSLIFGVGLSVNKIRSYVNRALKEQTNIYNEVHGTEDFRKKRSLRPKKKTQKMAHSVNKQFLERILKILKICVPSWYSKEALFLVLQSVLLVSRTLLSDQISLIEASSGRAIVSMKFRTFTKLVSLFALLAFPASLVNSGLKYMQIRLQLQFQQRLSQYLHKKYCSNRAYYAASVLQGLKQSDQRMTEDVEKFCASISQLYSYTFKPILDVILFTKSLMPIMGLKGQAAIYVYYIITTLILRNISPPLTLMTFQESTLRGGFRGAHQRLVSNAESVAFNDPPAGFTEELILNSYMNRFLNFCKRTAGIMFFQNVADNYLVKYMASVVALLMYALPLYYMNNQQEGEIKEVYIGNYLRALRLLGNNAKAIGDLVLIYKRITSLAGHTSRVSELLEQVNTLTSGEESIKVLYNMNLSSQNLSNLENSESIKQFSESSTYGDDPSLAPLPQSKRSRSNIISFHRVALNAPDGQPLIREFNLEIVPSQNVMVMGPNGSGKSSLLRVLAGLWPLQAGEISVPDTNQLFYLSQKPYLVTGTLRDQLLYPMPPLRVWEGSTQDDRDRINQITQSSNVNYHYTPEQKQVLDVDLENRLDKCLEIVELEKLLQTNKGWNQIENWETNLSGGEKQRIAMARLLFHRPQYAILDEATSAMNSEGEQRVYEACINAGITLLSIAHHQSLEKYHQIKITLNGGRAYPGWRQEIIQASQ